MLRTRSGVSGYLALNFGIYRTQEMMSWLLAACSRESRQLFPEQELRRQLSNDSPLADFNILHLGLHPGADQCPDRARGCNQFGGGLTCG